MKRSRFLTGLSLVVCLGLIGSGLAWWKMRAIKAAASTPAFEPSESVQVVTTGTTQWQPTARLLGSVFALQSIMLSNEIAGVVNTSNLNPGAVVEKDALLLRLDSEQEKADLAAARATVETSQAGVLMVAAQTKEAQAMLKLAQSEQERYVEAVAAKAAAPSLLDKASAETERALAMIAQMDAMAKRAEAELAQSRAKVRQLEVLIEKKTIKAPFKARIGIGNVYAGQYLAEGTNVINLEGISEDIYLDFAIPQDQASRVSIGETFPAKSSAFGNREVSIKVVALDAAVDRSTRNVRVRALVPGGGAFLRPGTYVEVEVPLAPPSDFIAVPITAVRRASFGDHVFVIAKDEASGQTRAKQRFIKLGPTVGDNIVVLEGLKVGEQIAAAGSFKLRENALVQLGPPPDAPGAAPGAPPNKAADADKH